MPGHVRLHDFGLSNESHAHGSFSNLGAKQSTEKKTNQVRSQEEQNLSQSDTNVRGNVRTGTRPHARTNDGTSFTKTKIKTNQDAIDNRRNARRRGEMERMGDAKQKPARTANYSNADNLA